MEYLTVAEVTERTGISAATIRAMARDNVVECYESSGRWVFPQRAVAALEEQLAATEAAIEEEGEDAEEEEDLDEDDDILENPDTDDDVLENPDEDDEDDEGGADDDDA